MGDRLLKIKASLTEAPNAITEDDVAWLVNEVERLRVALLDVAADRRAMSDQLADLGERLKAVGRDVAGCVDLVRQAIRPIYQGDELCRCGDIGCPDCDNQAAAIAEHPKVCKSGDETCPCPDGDPCHYEGEGAWPRPTDEAIAVQAAMTEAYYADPDV